MARFMRTDLGQAHSRLRPPAVIGAGIFFRGVQVNLARDLRTRPAQVVGQRAPLYFLKPPVVVGAAVVFTAPPIKVTLVTPQTPQQTGHARRHPYSRLRPPVVVNQAVELTGPEITLARIKPVATRPRLEPPTVVAAAFALAAVAVHLSRNKPGRPISRLEPPAIVGAGIAFHGPGVLLVRPFAGRPQAKSRLSPPAIAAAAAVYYGPVVSLAASSRGLAKPFLSPPAHVQVEPNRPPQLHLSYSRRGVAKPSLFPPIIPDLAEPTRVTLARNKPAPTQGVLEPPAVIGREGFRGVLTHLTYSQRGIAKPVLQPPAHVQVEPNRPLEVHLAYQSRRPGQGVLQPPAVVAAPTIFLGPKVTLTKARPQPTTTKLGVFPPQAVVYAPVSANLTYSRRGAPKSRLYPPVIPPLAEPVRVTLTRITPPPTYTRLTGLPTGASDVYAGPKVHLAPSSRGKPGSFLLPVTPGVAPFRPVAVSLATNKPQPTTASLEPPAVVQAQTVVFTGPVTTLTYSRRGEPTSKLKPPAAVGAGRFFRGLLVNLVTDRKRLALERVLQRAPHSRLGPPIVVRTAVELLGPKVELAPSRFPAPKSFLIPPPVVGQPPFRPLLVSLAPSRLPAPKPLLNPPAVVGKAPFRGLLISLTRNQPRPTTTLLRPPAVTRQPPFRPGQIHLTYSSRGAPASFLRPPSVVRQAPFRGLLLHLAYSRRGEPVTALKPPSVVNPPEAFQGPFVWLTYQSRGKPVYKLRPPTVTEVFFPGGDVCGFDVAASFVCLDETADTGHKITGGDGPVGHATGSDRKAT